MAGGRRKTLVRRGFVASFFFRFSSRNDMSIVYTSRPRVHYCAFASFRKAGVRTHIAGVISSCRQCKEG
jgi:hypothetical protein